MYASLVGPPNPLDPRNIPAVATAAAATTDEVTGYDDGDDGLGIGDDDYWIFRHPLPIGCLTTKW